MEPLKRAQLARVITAVEDGRAADDAVLKAGQARLATLRIAGITGPPGSGKSTLADALATEWAAAGFEVAVLAVDPSSPYSGGAILGDRFRMRRSEGLDRVYIRSLAARGHAGGLSAAAPDICIVLAAFGIQRIAIETVGAGQSDVEIKDHADCVVVVSVPGLGDGLQAAKAGIMEIGDIFVVNKADLPGADAVGRDLAAMLGLAYRGIAAPSGAAGTATIGDVRLRERHGAGERGAAWIPPVISLTATTGDGVTALTDGIESFFAWSSENGRFGARRRAMQRAQLAERARRLFGARLDGLQLGDGGALERWAERVIAGDCLPGDAARALLDAATTPAEAAAVAMRGSKRP